MNRSMNDVGALRFAIDELRAYDMRTMTRDLLQEKAEAVVVNAQQVMSDYIQLLADFDEVRAERDELAESDSADTFVLALAVRANHDLRHTEPWVVCSDAVCRIVSRLQLVA